jgi:hypothetical protein
VSQVGRNEPCPCGSGLKYKKCCLNKASAIAVTYRPAERDSALTKLMRFSRRDEFAETHKAAIELFWGDWSAEEPDDERDAVMKSMSATLAYHSWFAYDFDLGEGRTVLDLFLEKDAGKLGEGERLFLEGMRGSHLRLYEILEVKPDQGFTVRDLWDDRRLYVHERTGTREIVAWDIVVGRIGAGGGGETVFEILPYLFPAADKDDLLKGLRKAHQLFTREFPDQDLCGFFRKMAPVFHKLWLDRVALPPRPKIITGDGEAFIFAKVIFDLLDRATARRSLADRDDIVDHGDGTYVWLEPAGSFQRSVGTMIFEEKRVVFETTSQKRAEKARDELPGLLAGTVRFRAISYEDVEQALKHAPKTTKKEESSIPIEEQRKMLGEFYEQHYRKWLDEPVPALGNRTPRHAAGLKTMRPKVVALLKDFEGHSERQSRSGEIAYDFGWMWAELGLNRE